MCLAEKETLGPVTFLSLADVCERWGMSPGEVNGALVEDGFPAPLFASIDGVALWPRAAVDAWADRHFCKRR